ncbi:MAG: cobalamin biosynthesis protein [Lachnospiraceae bacterium]|nr:cobalamin biosynthesis protein [Lachnospiraceae bacterium]MDY3222516.1 cobalamin biosynthesis protein [Lachnospiraceae bacterium]
MKLYIISFTLGGLQLSRRLAYKLEKKGWPQTRIFTKCRAAKEECIESRGSNDESAPGFISFVEESIGEWAALGMEKGYGLLFIGACGIAVRAIAPSIRDKLWDSPVLVMDEKGSYVIPLLSGHVGGANELAALLAEVMGARPVITTATDIHGRFAVDLFAKRNQLYLENKEGIALISSKVLAGESVTFSIEPGHMKSDSLLPAELCPVPYPPADKADILVTAQKNEARGRIILRPREYVLGMGCRKGKEAGEIEAFIEEVLEEVGIQAYQLYALASIQLKKEEPGFLAFSRKKGIDFLTFSVEELKQVGGALSASAFVENTVGVDNVCERAALKACGQEGRLVMKKLARDGMTMAIAKKGWRVEF